LTAGHIINGIDVFFLFLFFSKKCQQQFPLVVLALAIGHNNILFAVKLPKDPSLARVAVAFDFTGDEGYPQPFKPVNVDLV
jgi:hypothetical protein